MITYILKSNITIRKIAEEYFILDRNNGMVHTFNHTGAYIWDNIVNNLSIDDIIKNMLNEYDLDPNRAKEDIFNFLLKLEKSELITIKEKYID